MKGVCCILSLLSLLSSLLSSLLPLSLSFFIVVVTVVVLSHQQHHQSPLPSREKSNDRCRSRYLSYDPSRSIAALDTLPPRPSPPPPLSVPTSCHASSCQQQSEEPTLFTQSSTCSPSLYLCVLSSAAANPTAANKARNRSIVCAVCVVCWYRCGFSSLCLLASSHAHSRTTPQQSTTQHNAA